MSIHKDRKCDRANCNNLHSSRSSHIHGYICDECFNELIQLGVTTDVQHFVLAPKKHVDVNKIQAAKKYFKDVYFNLSAEEYYKENLSRISKNSLICQKPKCDNPQEHYSQVHGGICDGCLTDLAKVGVKVTVSDFMKEPKDIPPKESIVKATIEYFESTAYPNKHT